MLKKLTPNADSGTGAQVAAGVRESSREFEPAEVCADLGGQSEFGMVAGDADFQARPR